MLSVLDLFRVGIGPSSSHTVGPIRIAARFVEQLAGQSGTVARVEVELQGSLALTGEGHATPKAVMLGLAGFEPETLDPDEADAAVASITQSGRLSLGGRHPIEFNPSCDIVLAYDVIPTLHPNGMRLKAFDEGKSVIADETWYSTGGGFIASQ
ncbi:MAG: serine dehydratase beta chain, partial [Pseudomonadota bacterium]|nr:serine dehydratase beta chain [Pseudomonadota bacterium]